MKAVVQTRRMLKSGVGLASVLTLAFTLACGSASAPSGADSVVAGIVSSDAPVSAVYLKDSSEPAKERSVSVDGENAFSIDASDLRAPFFLKAEVAEGETHRKLYAVSGKHGRANISDVSDTAVRCGDDESDDADDAYEHGDRERTHRRAVSFERVIGELQTVLKQLFELYDVPADPFTNDRPDPALRNMLRDVRIVVKDRQVFVTNRATRGVIFSGPTRDLASGTYDPTQLPSGPKPVPTPTETPTPVPTETPVPTPTETPTPPPETPTPTETPPAACSYTYSLGPCQPDGTRTPTVASASPEGCVGTPVLTPQSCTYTPPVTTCTAFTYSAWGACQSNNTQTRTLTSSSPTGCTGGTPEPLTQTCTYTPPTQACNTCHGYPPSSGMHSFHVSSKGISCSTCHGAGYVNTGVTAATHMNGTKNVASTIGFNGSTCTNSCHGSKSW